MIRAYVRVETTRPRRVQQNRPVAIERAVLALVVLITLGTAGCGAPPTIDVKVKVHLRYPLIKDFVDADPAEQCGGALEYSDLQTGSTVTITDAGGKIVGATELWTPTKSSGGMECVWESHVTVQSNSEFFRAEVGGWASAPIKPKDDSLVFLLQSWKQAVPFGHQVQLDSRWIRQTHPS
jgi:hypothetical protein